MKGSRRNDASPLRGFSLQQNRSSMLEITNIRRKVLCIPGKLKNTQSTMPYFHDWPQSFLRTWNLKKFHDNRLFAVLSLLPLERSQIAPDERNVKNMSMPRSQRSSQRHTRTTRCKFFCDPVNPRNIIAPIFSRFFLSFFLAVRAFVNHSANETSRGIPPLQFAEW